MNPRPYQSEAIAAVRAAILAGLLRLLVVLSTGGGKTVIASMVIMGAIAKGSRVLFLAHRRELIRQPACKLMRYGVPPEQIGIIMAGVPLPEPTGMLELPGAGPLDSATDRELWSAFARRRPDAPVQIASVDTLRNYDRPPPAGIVIVDEAHRTLAKSYQAILGHYPNAIVIGLTATAQRGDRRGLGEYFQHIEVIATYKQLAAQRFLATPRVFTVDVLPDLSQVRSRGGDYDIEQLAEVCNDNALIGDIIDHWQRRGNDAPTLVFAAGVKHSLSIVERFNEAGVPAAHVDGSTPADERDAIFEKLETGALRVVSNCDVATEGTDIPCVKTIIMARPTQSVRVYLQQAGRGSRPHPNGLPFIILDHAGNAMRHGLPQADREWSLEAPKRRSSRKGVPPCWRCEDCLAINEITAVLCEECRAERPRKVRRQLAEHAGELVELTDDLMQDCWELVVEEWHAKNDKRDKPMKPGWCFHRYKKRFGVAPPKGVKWPKLSDGQKADRAHAEALEQVAQERGYKPSWVHVQLAQQRASEPKELEQWAV